MGTRHLVAVQIDNEYKVAQYGQWDGYPAGQGLVVLAFLTDMDRTKFEASVRACVWADQAYIDAMNDDCDIPRDAELVSYEKMAQQGEKYPHMCRDTGAGILTLVAQSDGLTLHNEIDFAKQSLFCEWAYVIDLDINSFEVYKGFNTSSVVEGRFVGPVEANGYGPVTMLKPYSLDSLPIPAQFIEDLKSLDDE